MTPMVLVVDDEAIARNFIERALSQEGYQVVVASDGETALEILRSMDRKVALVITDLVMPGMGGHEFALEVGKLPSPPPVLYISAYEKPKGEMAQRFLQKPFSITDLTSAVARLMPEMASRGSRV
jgi:two-component system, cell cycle sensor histidine kinase and response regulator CckA